MTTLSYASSTYGFMKPGIIVHHISFACGYALGVWLWLTLLIQAACCYSHVFSDTLLLRFNRILGVTMISFGTYWGYEHLAHAILLILRDGLKFAL
ncbi:MAG: hypothetical protein RML40_05150 [Bacteroidota bacterium]|nr:hypothetical protein [Candidatus Kapabacteria bacterium]MDW8219899.1 hypothetical protein [Bacteroidota bacterium]